MELIHIKGGKPLQGSVKVGGAKNAVTKMLVASMLSDKPCTFYNVPNIGDVEVTVSLCQEVGMEVQWDRKAQTMHVVTKELKTTYVPQRFSGSNRVPILMLGALLGRTEEEIIVPTTGGCDLGARPVDFHVQALQKLGAVIEYRVMKKEGAYFAHAHRGLKGAVITLPYPSVGATENTILAGVRAKGETVIRNAAIEPEIVDLVLFLQKLGVNISLDVDRVIRIEGTTQFYEIEHTVIADRNEAASFAMAAIATKGRVFVEGAIHYHLIPLLNRLREIGGGFNIKSDGIEFFYSNPLKGGAHIETDVHPGFMSDWQQPFVVLLTQAQGASVVHETVHEHRFGYTDALREMGADVKLFKQCLGGKCCRYAAQGYAHSLVVKGMTPLYGREIAIPDLRAGFAYAMAALVAEGESLLSGVHFLKRGYEHVVEKLTALNADIVTIPSPTERLIGATSDQNFEPNAKKANKSVALKNLKKVEETILEPAHAHSAS